jgi:hypothetical protein
MDNGVDCAHTRGLILGRDVLGRDDPEAYNGTV